MTRYTTLLLLLLPFATLAEVNPDTLFIPTRAVVLHGDPSQPDAADMIGVFYSTEDSYFNDPGAPRFLLLDKEGRVAFGIGGQIRGTLRYDFDGSIDDGANFVTYDIPVPNTPLSRQAFGADASHSSIFFKLIGNTHRFGYYQAYVQTNFTGANGGYGLRLRQAWLSLGYVTIGFANSTFVDAAATPPGIDEQGPSGDVSKKNVLLRYAPKLGRGFSLGVAVEVPTVNYDAAANRNAVIPQRVPDIPLYLQYSWMKGSHVRLTGMLRNMAYRNVVEQRNRFCTGWGVKLSTVAQLWERVTLYGKAAYGHGIATYFNDLSEADVDLVPLLDGSGRMEAPGMLGLVAGVQYRFTPSFFWSASWSLQRLYDRRQLGASEYRRATYVATNLFYSIIDDLKVGIEYLYGERVDMSRATGHANRLTALLQYEF